MSLRLLTDENVDHRIVHRLEHYGHDVEHVDFVAELGKGNEDAAIADYSLDSDRLILTSDDDFLADFETGEYRGLLFIEDETLSVEDVAEIVHAIAGAIGHDQIDAVLYVIESDRPLEAIAEHERALDPCPVPDLDQYGHDVLVLMLRGRDPRRGPFGARPRNTWIQEHTGSNRFIGRRGGQSKTYPESL